MGKAAANAWRGWRSGTVTHPYLPGRLSGQGGSLLGLYWGFLWGLKSDRARACAPSHVVNLWSHHGRIPEHHAGETRERERERGRERAREPQLFQSPPVVFFPTWAGPVWGRSLQIVSVLDTVCSQLLEISWARATQRSPVNPRNHKS